MNRKPRTADDRRRVDPLDPEAGRLERQRPGVVVHRVDRDGPDDDRDHREAGDDGAAAAQDRVDRVDSTRRRSPCSPRGGRGSRASPRRWPCPRTCTRRPATATVDGQVAGVVGGVQRPGQDEARHDRDHRDERADQVEPAEPVGRGSCRPCRAIEIVRIDEHHPERRPRPTSRTGGSPRSRRSRARPWQTTMIEQGDDERQAPG